MSNVIRPFLGVAYYPEDWPETEMIPDMKRMKEIGIQTIRIAECCNTAVGTDTCARKKHYLFLLTHNNYQLRRLTV